MKMTLTKPCPKCPFRTDIKPFLTTGRAREICRELLQGQATFACHQTTKFDDDGEYLGHSEKEQHCAGALIFLELQNRPNQLMRIYERIRSYDRRKLKMDSPVFKSATAMVKAQKRS